MDRNPFLVLPDDVCSDPGLAAWPEDQDCTSYLQKKSQVCAIVVLPKGAEKPSNWETLEGWAGIIDNTNTDRTKGRYLVGIGSFLPNQEIGVSLSGDRHNEIRDRNYRLTFTVLNMDDGHMQFGRRIERGYKGYDVWLETIGGRLIGGPEGMQPVVVNAQFPFSQANTAREQLLITMDFFFLQFPDVTSLTLSMTESPYFWGDPNAPEIWGDPGAGEGWGFFQ